jgi:2-dehydropantoate 2-reductase
MARIAIVGVGAIGSAVAALLEKTGRHEVLLCVRRPLPQLIVEYGADRREVRGRRLLAPAEAPAVDWVLVATKTYDVAGAAAWLPALRAAGAPVAVLQNGVEHRERFAPYVPRDKIVPVVVDVPTERTGPGLVLQRRVMKLRAPDSAAGREFVGLFAGTDVQGETPADFETALWRKLCLNSAGILPALTLKPAGVFRGAAIGAVAAGIVRECVAVARAEGADIEPGFAEEIVQYYRASSPDSVNSLHADRLAGRPMELDARNGVIVRLGQKHGIPTPLNAMAMALLEAMTA